MHAISRLTRLVILCIVTLWLGSNMAAAENIPVGGGATPAGNGVDLSATSSSSSNGQKGGGGSGTGVTCRYTPLADMHDPSIPNPGKLGGVTDAGQVIAPNTAGTWVYKECTNPDGTYASGLGVTFIPQGSPVSPVQLMQDARNHLPLPAPEVQFSPAANLWQYVQMPTWAWVPGSRWTPLRASASAGSVSVTVTATPVRLVFTYQTKGDGTTATASCGGPGTPYSDELATAEDPKQPVLAASPDCGWTWHQSSADTADRKYDVTAHAVYHVVWTVSGAAGGGDLGELVGQDTNLRVSVGEIQAVNTTPR